MRRLLSLFGPLKIRILNLNLTEPLIKKLKLWTNFKTKLMPLLNPIYWLADGGGSIAPSLYFLIVIQIYNIWYVFWKPLGSVSIICQKNGNFAKSKYLLRNLVDTANSNVQKYLQKFKNLNVYSRKTENL